MLYSDERQRGLSYINKKKTVASFEAVCHLRRSNNVPSCKYSVCAQMSCVRQAENSAFRRESSKEWRDAHRSTVRRCDESLSELGGHLPGCWGFVGYSIYRAHELLTYSRLFVNPLPCHCHFIQNTWQLQGYLQQLHLDSYFASADKILPFYLAI